MKHVTHFIDGRTVAASDGETLPIINPASGREIGSVALASNADVDSAVAAARAAQPAWSRTGLQFRADMMLNLRDAIKGARSELTQIVVAELGKTRADASAEVDRAIEVLGQAASVGNWYGSVATPGVSTGVDVQEIRFPIGVVAAISPFNFRS